MQLRHVTGGRRLSTLAPGPLPNRLDIAAANTLLLACLGQTRGDCSVAVWLQAEGYAGNVLMTRARHGERLAGRFPTPATIRADLIYRRPA